MHDIINSIIEAISIALNAEFGDGYTIHMEEIKQGLKEPCFYISCLNPSSGVFLWHRYFREEQFCIQYFPESADYKRECNEAAERMWQCLEYITCLGDEKPIRGNQMHWDVVDGVLNFFVNYDLFVRKPEDDTETMGTIDGDVLIKGGD